MKNLFPSQDKKDIALVAFALIIACIYFVFIFKLQARSLKEVSGKLASQEGAFKQFKKDLSNLKALEDELAMLKNKSAYVEQELLDSLTINNFRETILKKASSAGVKIKTVNFADNQPGGKIIEIGGFKLSPLPIDIELAARYFQAVKFLSVLCEDLPVKINDVTITRGPDMFRHAVSVNLETYVKQK